MADCFREISPSPSESIIIDRCPLVKSSCYYQKIDLKSAPKIFANLCKLKLTSLVTFTSLGGYLLAAGPMDPILMVATMGGVFLCSCSANCINHFLDAPFDAQMIRTHTRVLPMGLMKLPEASMYLSAWLAVCGSSILYYYANPLSCLLGFLNIILYGCAYTPLKRFSLYNTHLGSIVGAIPPLIGWVAATGSFDTGCLPLMTILFCWQFVHFNSLSWGLRNDYSRAGYQMTAVIDPQRLRTSTLLNSIILFLVCLMSPSVTLSHIPFVASTIWINILTIYSSYKFYLEPNFKNSQLLFRMSLVQITIIISAIVGLYLYEKYKSHPTAFLRLANLWD